MTTEGREDAQIWKRQSARLTQRRDFQWAFGLNRLSLDLIGIWPNENDPRGRAGLRHLRVPFMVVWMLVGLFLPQMYALSQVLSQLPLIVDNLTTSCAALTSSVKLFLLWNSRQGDDDGEEDHKRWVSYSKVLRPVVKSVMSDWTREKTAWERDVMERRARSARLFTISGYAIMFVCFVGFIATPFFGFSIRIVNNVTDTRADDGRFFPLQTYYPYEATESPYFELTYASQLIAGSFVGISFSVPDNFFGALVFHASAQCEILGTRMSKLLPGDDSSRRVEWKMLEDERRFVRIKLRQLVEAHVRLIRFVDEVENSFNLLILAQVLCLSLIICCLGFGVIKSLGSKGENPPVVQVVTLVGTLLNLMIHMLVYCIASEILSKNSLDFFHAVYCSNWYALPGKCSRDIIPIMIRSKFPLRLTAGKFFYLSLNAYLKILKNSIGYISMLLAVTS